MNGQIDYGQMLQQLQAQRGAGAPQGQPAPRPMMGANGMPVGAPQGRPQAIRGPAPGQPPPQTAENMQPDPQAIQQALLEQQQGMR